MIRSRESRGVRCASLPKRELGGSSHGDDVIGDAGLEGRTQGAHLLLLHLLGKRFGPLPEDVRQRVETITSLNRLTKLAERVHSAHSLEEMGLA